MRNSIQPFDYKGDVIRAVMIDEEAWLVAKDVCDVLGHTNSRMAVQELDEDEKGVSNIYTPGGMQSMTVINEAGVYKLTFKSRKPAAKEFTRWVTHKVLPTLRKTGSYSVKRQLSEDLKAIQVVLEPAGISGNQLSLALDRAYKFYTGHSALSTAGVELEAPTKNQILTPTEIGAQFGLSARRVNEILAGAGFQHRIADKWEPLRDGVNYAIMQDTGKAHSDGTPIRQLKWNSSILGVFKGMLAQEEDMQ